MRAQITAVLAATLTVSAGAASAQALAAAALRDQAPVVQGTGDYRIGPQDTLEVDVFQLSDLNRTVQVDATGHILMPLIGQMQAAGKTSDQLSHDIADQLGKKYVNNPQVTVVVKDAQGLRITVDGAVGQPG